MSRYSTEQSQTVIWFGIIRSSMLQAELGWEPSLQFEKGIENTVMWYLENEAFMDNITSGEYEKYYSDMYKGKTV